MSVNTEGVEKRTGEASTAAEKKAHAESNRRKEEDRKIELLSEEEDWVKASRPIRSLTGDQTKVLKKWLDNTVWPREKIICPNFPEAFLVGSKILEKAFEKIGYTDDEKLERARVWDCLVDYIKEYFRKRLDRVMKDYTNKVVKGRLYRLRSWLGGSEWVRLTHLSFYFGF